MDLPLIGVTAGYTYSPTNLRLLSTPSAYLTALRRTGALPVVLPLGLEPAGLEALLGHLDGLVLSGGGDLHPDNYSGSRHPKVAEIDTDRDSMELQTASLAVQAGLPLLGVCRGLQVLNVALGGSLFEDLLDQRPGSERHDFGGEFPRNYEAHPVQIQPGTRLAEILQQDNLPVNSLHHQGIRELAPDLTPSAHAPDGLIEAFEIKAHPYALAVQWHPEWMQNRLVMQALFASLTAAAAVYQQQKA